MSEQFQENLITDNDRRFLDGLDASLSEREEMDQDLECLCDEIPRNQNAIKLLDQYADYYDFADAGERRNFIKTLEQIIERDEGPNSFLSRVAATFLEYINDDSEYEEYDIDEEDY